MPSLPRKLAGREHVDAGDLEIGREHAARIARVAPGETLGEHARLLMRRLDQSVADAAMLGAFADRVDARDIRLERVIDHDAAVHRDAGLARKIGARPDADRHHHGVGLDGAAVLQRDAVDAILAADLGSIGVEDDLDAHGLDRALEHARGLRDRAGAPSGGPSDAAR